MCCELYYRGSQANYQLCIKQENDRERKREEGRREGKGKKRRWERGVGRERGECVLFEPVYSDFCKVPLCFGDCASEASPMGYESPVHTLNRDGENVLQEMTGSLEILFSWTGSRFPIDQLG